MLNFVQYIFTYLHLLPGKTTQKHPWQLKLGPIHITWNIIIDSYLKK